MAKQHAKKPEAVFRVGNVSASIWVQLSGASDNEREFRNVTLQRSYLDDDGKRQYSGSLSLGDLANAIRVMSLAQGHIEELEARVLGAD